MFLSGSLFWDLLSIGINVSLFMIVWGSKLIRFGR